MKASIGPFIAVALLISLLVLSGCGLEERDLTGDVFIVTKGGENVRLALVEVRLFTEKQILDIMERQIRQTKEKIRKIDLDLKKIKDKMKETPLTDEEYLRVPLCGLHTYIDENGEIHFANTKNPAARLRQRYEANLYLRAQYAEGRFLLIGTPDGVAKVLTDADGKFVVRLKTDKKYALMASATRNVGDKVEEYSWLIWVSLEGKKSNKVMLSNHNLLRANPPESVVKLEGLEP